MNFIRKSEIMPNTRRQNRELAFILIFEKQFRDDSVDDIIELAQNIDDFNINTRVINAFKNVTQKASEFDQIIEKFSVKRSVERIPKVNLAILRLALYEAIYDENVPLNVAINEAVLLAKKFAQKADVQFINGVLGAYARDKEGKADA